MNKELEAVAHLFASCTHVGSRVTCDPAPTTTDDDYLCLIKQDSSGNLVDQEMRQRGWVLGGSKPTDDTVIFPDDQFWSYTNGELNLIVTASVVFHKRFMAATSVCKHLNLLDKNDRIRLFQAVLYGIAPELA